MTQEKVPKNATNLYYKGADIINGFVHERSYLEI